MCILVVLMLCLSLVLAKPLDEMDNRGGNGGVAGGGTGRLALLGGGGGVEGGGTGGKQARSGGGVAGNGTGKQAGDAGVEDGRKGKVAA